MIIFSFGIGIIKPCPKIFLKAMEALNTDISKVVYIGDSMERDIAGASNLGMSTIWIRNNNHVKNDIGAQTDFVINDLCDFVDDKNS